MYRTGFFRFLTPSSIKVISSGRELVSPGHRCTVVETRMSEVFDTGCLYQHLVYP
jgi:hypothetical protein